MKRYERSDGKSHKFWSVFREGSEVTTSWGRVGTNGQHKTKSFSDAASAQKEVLTLIRSKVKKGYVLVSGEDETPPARDALRTHSPLSKGKDRAQQNILEEAAGAAAAALGDCPPVLLEPRWLSRKPTPNLPTLTLTPLNSEPSIVWPKGLREEWLERRGKVHPWMQPEDGNYEPLLASWGTRSDLLGSAPEAVVRPYLCHWNPAKQYDAQNWAMHLIARYELDVLPNALAYLKADAPDAMPCMLPFRTPEVAAGAAMALQKFKSVRKEARAWLRRHPEAAFEGLLPLAFSAKRGERTSALGAIALLVGEGHGPTLERVAARYGEAVATATTPLLNRDLLDQLPEKMPELPEWTRNVVPPELRSGGCLPEQALTNFLTMLAISAVGRVYAGVPIAAQALTPASLARFSWSLFEAWRRDGMDSKHNWAFTQLGLFGDDSCARNLTPILRNWPGEGGHARATMGLNILASIGSDVALMKLYGVSQNLGYKRLRHKANQKIQEIARKRGLSELELADRLVPDFDLGAQGTLELDFGPRKFTVTFDEHLNPVLRDEGGNVRKRMPEVAAKDDPNKGAEATRLFEALKKDVRSVSRMQIARLARAMCDGRSWSAEDFHALFVDHPLMIHLVRRLVWQSGEGAEAQTFRVAEDRSIANVKDDEVRLGPGPVRICHRLDLSDELAAQWGEVFADHELLQPFAQLGRDVYTLTEKELADKEIKRVDKLVVPTRKVLLMRKLGWAKGLPRDSCVIEWMERKVPGFGAFVMHLDPGIVVSLPEQWPEQTLGSVQFHKDSSPDGDVGALNSLPATMVSEVLRALESLKTS